MNDDKTFQRDLRRRRGWYRFFRAVTITMLMCAVLIGGFVVGVFSAVSKMLPADDKLSTMFLAQPTRILASDGSLLAKIYQAEQNREIVPLQDMGQNLQLATLAIEDERFYYHPGVDVRGILRAAVKNIRSGDTKEGASTITQQLVRGQWLNNKKTFTRKLQEMILALEIERRFSKDEILETYLNQVYYGSNPNSLQSYGAQMAARNFFGKSAKDLTLAEAALLAGLPKNPRDNNPYSNPKNAKERRDLVLATMRDNKVISEEDYQKAVKEPIKLITPKPVPKMADAHAPYFVDYILRTELAKIYGEDREDMVYKYGLVIHTTLDPRMQKQAEEVVTEGVKANKFRNIEDGALISIDPKTGFIKAMVGGTNFDKDQYNVVTQGRRQPGSAFKPFVYTTALLHGYTPDTTVYDKPGRYPTGTGEYWSPKNSDGSYRGAMPLKKALWLSRNGAAAGVAYDIGIDKIIDTAYRMGINKEHAPLQPYLSTSLGASDVEPLDICSAYGTLANKGVHNPPTGIKLITNAAGETLYEYTPHPVKALPTDVADTMKKVMRGVIEVGTARAARCDFPASGKTGTTNSYRDAWFIGYTDDLVTAVWVGNRSSEPMNRTFGGTVPAPIWKQFMEVAHPIMADEHKKDAELAKQYSLPEPTDLDRSPTQYIAKTYGDRLPRQSTPEPTTASNAGQPVTMRICLDSQQIATPQCPNTGMRTYIRGQEEPPTQRCTVHGRSSKPGGGDSNQGGIVIFVCAETGKIATPRCPDVVARRFHGDAPRETCPLHQE